MKPGATPSLVSAPPCLLSSSHSDRQHGIMSSWRKAKAMFPFAINGDTEEGGEDKGGQPWGILEGWEEKLWTRK